MNRYFVTTGATANWNDPRNWSSTSGGVGGDVLGSELIVNAADREFTSDTGFWSKGVGWSISGGVAKALNVGSGSTIEKPNFLTVGKTYNITYTITNYVSGYCFAYVGNGTGASRAANGTYSDFIVATSNGYTGIRAYSNFTADIDNISIQEVQTIPTSSDNAIFDANSLSAPCNLTINAEANCADLDFSGLDNLLTLTNSAYNLNVYGNLTLASNTYLNTSFTGTGYLQLKATTSVNITSNGCTRGWNNIYFDGVGGEWTNQDDWTTPTEINHKNGEMIVNGYTLDIRGGYAYVTGGGVKKLNIANSILNVYRFYGGNQPDGFSVDSTNSTINVESGLFFGGARLYNNVNLLSSGSVEITNSDTFNNLNYQPIASNNNMLSLKANITVLSNLTLVGGNSSNNRILIASNTLGTPRTITCNGTVTASNVDFRDITLAGTAAPVDLSAITGGSGDCGGNSGITFTPAVNQYFKHTSGAVNWSDTTKWFTTSGGSTQGRVPLPQDDAIFDANSFTGASTLSVNVPRIGGLNMEGVNQAVTFAPTAGFQCCKDFIFGQNITSQGNYEMYMIGRSNKSINTFGKQICGNSSFYTWTGYLTVLSNLVFNNSFINDYNGTTDFNGYNLTASKLYGQFSVGRTLQIQALILRNGTFTLTSTSGGSFYGASYGTDAANSTIILSPITGSSNIIFSPNAISVSFGRIVLSGNHTGSFVINLGASFSEIVVNSGKTLKFTNGTIQTIAKLTAIGTPSAPITIESTTAGSAYNINYTGTKDTLQFARIKDANVTGNLWVENGTDLGNNTGLKWIYSVAKKTMGFVLRLVKD